MTTSAEVARRIEAFRDRHRVPAIGAGVVSVGDAPRIAVAGVRVRGERPPVTLDDRWHIGSCGKSITGALFARLVERGDADWSAPIADCFPDLAGDLDLGWRSVPALALLTCESGLPADLAPDDLRAAYADPRPLVAQRSEIARRALARPPQRPGRFLYSNLGYIVAGAAIERATGVPFESALEAHVLVPLGISSGGFGPPPQLWGHGGRMRQLPLGAILDLGRSRPLDPAHSESDNPPVMAPAGTLHLSLSDWAAFLRVFLVGGGDGFLGAETVRRLLTSAPGGGRRMACGWVAARGLPGVSHGQQGSNTSWVATALLAEQRDRIAFVACSEGSARLLRATPALAASLLART